MNRKPVEEALRANEERLRLALDAARLATWDWDIASGKVVWNDQHYRVLGYEPGAFEPTYQFWAGRVHPEDLPAAEAKIRQTMADGSEYVNRFRTLWPDGTVRYLEALGRFERDAAGKAVRCYGAMLDVTERQRAGEEMARLASFPLLNPNPIVEIDAEGRLFFVNPTAERLFPELHQKGTDHPWLVNWSSFLPGASGDVDKGRSREIQVTDCWYYQTFFIVPQTQHMRVYGLDITKLKAAQAELKSLNEVLEHRVAERTAELEHRSDQLRKLTLELTLAEQRERQRLAMILHDGLQQTLVAAKFRLALAERGRNVARAAADAANLIDDSIEISRTLTAELSPTILQQRDLIAALEWLAHWMSDKHGLEVNLTARDKVDIITEEAMVLLFQATRELLFNVVKHAGVKTARVQLGQVEGCIHVTVKDAGAGFDPRQLRAEGGQAGGTGLFSIRERVSLVGGRLEIESCPGQGSQFKLIIPLSIAQVAAATSPAGGRAQISVAILPQPQVAQAVEQRKIRLLLVDDHMVMRQGLAALLRVEPDMEIAGEASDGESAVSMALDLRPDVVLMDIGMPGMDGIQATRTIHNKIPEITIIGLSMFVEKEKAAAIKDAGAVNYLEKSGPSEALIAAIRACRRHAQKEAGTTSTRGSS